MVAIPSAYDYALTFSKHRKSMSIKVLHIGKYYPPFAGGIETFSCDLLNALHQQGITVAAIVHEHQTQAEKSETLTFPYPVYRVPTYGSLLFAPLSPAFPFWLAKTIDAFQPDILHLHLPNTSAFAALALPSARKLPWIIHWHADVETSSNHKLLSLAYPFYRPFEQALCRKAHSILVTSPPYLASSQSLKAWKHKCHVVPLGMSKQHFPQPQVKHIDRANKLWGTATNKILTVGRLSYYKGHDILIQAALQLPPESKVIIVGSGEQQTALQQQIKHHQLEETVILTGRLPNAELAALFTTSDLFCLPSLERAEAFGMVLLNAMFYARAIVASDIPGSGVGWVVNQGVNGLLVPPADPTALADGLQNLCSNPALRQQYGAAGNSRFNQEFDIQNSSRTIIEHYQQVVS